jgi:hypothetical protein
MSIASAEVIRLPHSGYPHRTYGILALKENDCHRESIRVKPALALR